MTSRRAVWREIRAVLTGIVMMLPLIQVAAPGLLALSAENEVWCRTLAPGESGRSNSSQSTQEGSDCLVCLAATIGGNSATPATPIIPAPRAVALTTLPVSLAGLVDASDETCPPIRAPPFADLNVRSPAACATGCALT